jgi:tetratricopeptide (TPR) repeat protein
MGVSQSTNMSPDLGELSPEDLGNCAFSNRDYELAIENYNRVSPMTDSIRARIIKVLDKMNSNDQIISIAKQITSQVTADVAYIIANAYHSTCDYDSAITYTSQAATQAPSKVIYRILLGKIYYDKASATTQTSNSISDYHSSLEQYNIVYSIYTNLSRQNYAEVQLHRGLIFQRFGKYNDSIDALEDAYYSTSNPVTLMSILKSLTESYIKTERHLDAIQNCDIILNSPQLNITDYDRGLFERVRTTSRDSISRM